MDKFREMSFKSLIFEHRVAAIRWQQEHDKEFLRDDAGNYLPFTGDGHELNDAKEYCISIEEEIMRRS